MGTPPRVALVHSFYRGDQPSGENEAVLRQAACLERAGFDVALVSRHTDDLMGRRLYRLESALTVMTGVGSDPTAELRDFAPDVVHVHNLFPNYGTRWLARWDGHLVHTLHNFRPICANGLLFRDGATCTLCPEGHRSAAVRYACYGGSKVATLPLAISISGGLRRNPLMRHAGALIALSDRSRTIYAKAGVEDARLHVIANGLVDPGLPSAAPPSAQRWMVVSRLTEEKGVRQLLSAWPSGVALDVYGDGPQRPALERAAPEDVRFLGNVPHDLVMAALPDVTGLVFPSRCLENSPMAVIEALASGVPVVALTGSAGADMAAAIDSDWVYSDATGPASAMASVVAAGEEARRRARRAYEETYSEHAWVNRLRAVYALSPETRGA